MNEQDVTEKVLRDAASYRLAGGKVFARSRPANPKKLSSMQQQMLSRFDGAELGFVSNVLLFDSAFKSLSVPQHKAVLDLVRGGVLRVYRVPGPMTRPHRSSWTGSNAEWHYVMQSNQESTPMKRNPPRGEVDEDAAAELMIYIVNTAELYDSNSMGASIEKNLAKKWKAGKFDPELAVKGYMHLVDAGAKRYVKEYGSSSPSWHEMFNVPTRRLVAQELVDAFEYGSSSPSWHEMFNVPTRRLVAQELVDAFVAEAKLGNFRG